MYTPPLQDLFSFNSDEIPPTDNSMYEELEEQIREDSDDWNGDLDD